MTFSHEPPLTRREARLREEARTRLHAAGHHADTLSSAGPVTPPDDVFERQPPVTMAPLSETPRFPGEKAIGGRRAGRAERELQFTQSNPIITQKMQEAAAAEERAKAGMPEPSANASGLTEEQARSLGRPLTRRELRELAQNRDPSPPPPLVMPGSSDSPLQTIAPLFPSPLSANPPSISPQPEVEAADVLSPELRGVDIAPNVLSVEQPWAERVPEEHATPHYEVPPAFSAGSSLTTSALVLPTLPMGDATRPFNNTGEILITGSIDLPRSLASRGYPSAQFENTELDSLFAGEDAEAPSDSSPVRASKAVSSHTSTHDVISVKKPVSHRLPVVLMVTAIVLAVGVAALAVVGVVTGVF